MKRPEELTADHLWTLLGYYTSCVAEAEGVLFSKNYYVNLACDQWYEEKDSEPAIVRRGKVAGGEI